MDWHSTWEFLRDDKNLAILKWLGGGVIVVLGALWAVFKFVKKSATTQTPINVSNSTGVAIGNTVNQEGMQVVAGSDATINIAPTSGNDAKC
ncbi:hypothetical protein [Solidesulfovibrio sp. C21]|uniref:hypothetical protein n=1 Tax=Solidesulfovibrio sp. C21 TaxID=3398613 RepID=UPI0039FDA1C7